MQAALHPQWKSYALAQDFMSAEAFAARQHLTQSQQAVLEQQDVARRTPEQERAVAEAVAAQARQEAVEHIEEARAGLQAFLDEAADAVEVRPASTRVLLCIRAHKHIYCIGNLKMESQAVDVRSMQLDFRDCGIVQLYLDLRLHRAELPC